MVSIIQLWRDWFGTFPTLSTYGEFAVIVEYVVCAIVSVLVVVLFFRLIISFINAVFR